MLKRLFDFRGRANRKEFWAFFAVSMLLTTVFDFCAAAIASVRAPSDQLAVHDGVFGALIAIWMVPWFAVCVRRLHDRGKSGWMLVLLYGIPLSLIIIGIAVSSLGAASSSTIEIIRFLSLAASIYVMLELGAGESSPTADRHDAPRSRPT